MAFPISGLAIFLAFGVNGKRRQVAALQNVCSVAAVLLAFLAAGCAPAREEMVPPNADSGPSELTVLYTCDTRGHLYTCDCKGGKAGGMTRRAAWLKQQTAPNRLLVDAGNNTAGTREWEAIEFEHVLKAYQEMGYHAVNLGHREAGFSKEELLGLRTAFPELVSANLVDEGMEALFPPYRVVRLEGGMTVGVLGVMGDDLPADELGGGLFLLPAGEAVSRYLYELLPKVDLVVLLAFVKDYEFQQLSELFFEIPLMIGGDVDQPTSEPVALNKSLMVAVTDKGKTIGRLDLVVNGSEWLSQTNELTTLYEDFPEDEEMQWVMAEFEEALRAKNYEPGEKLGEDEEGLSLISAEKEGGGK